MDYISTKEAAQKWGVSLRYVQRFLKDDRIPGARKYGVSWLIPKDAKRPDDLRKTGKQAAEKAPRWLLMTPTVFSKRNLSVVGNAYSSRYRPLLEADMAYRRGDPMPGMAAWKATPDSDPAKLTAATIATVAAISAGNFDLYDEIQTTLRSCMARARDKREKALLGLPEALAAVSMSAVGMTPQWLRDGDFSLFPREHIPLLLYLYALHLRNIDDKKAVLHTAKTSFELCAQTNTFTWLDVYNLTLCAQASFDLGDKAQAKKYLTSAMKLGLPAGMIAPFADYLGTLGGLMEACLEACDPQ